MKLKLKHKILVGILVVVLSLCAMIGIVVNDKLSSKEINNFVINKDQSITVTTNDGWIGGEWNIESKYSTDSPNITITEGVATDTLSGVVIDLANVTDDMEENVITYNMKATMTKESNAAAYAVATMYGYLPVPTLPTSTTLTRTYDAESGRLLLENSSGTVVGFYEISGDAVYCEGSATDCSAKATNGDFTTKMYVTLGENALYIRNAEEVPVTDPDGFDFDVTIKFAYDDSILVDDTELEIENRLSLKPAGSTYTHYRFLHDVFVKTYVEEEEEIVPTVTPATFTKQVKDEAATAFANTVTVNEGEEYSYKLYHTFASDVEEVRNLVFVDVLENAYGSNAYFKGILDSVDVSYFEDLTDGAFTPTIYYSTASSIDVSNVNLSDTTVWGTTKPSDAATITAIAVDCGTNVIKRSTGVNPTVTINMIAPNSYDATKTKKAYNNATIKYTNVATSESMSMETNTSEVTLNATTLNVGITSNVGKGTETAPAPVAGEFNYVLTVANTSDKNDYENVEVELYIPEGLSIPEDGVLVESNLTTGVTGTYSFDEATRILTYTVTKINPSETKTITIDLDLNLDVLGNTAFVGVAKLTKLENNDYTTLEDNVYNRIAVPELEFGKYVDTADTTGFTDEATVLITSGETYTYRVKVENVSDVAATNVKVVDNVPTGLTVNEASITNNGVYDSTNNTITWNITSLAANTTLNLDYTVTVPTDIELGTVYRSNATIDLVHPIDDSLKLYDNEDTNIVSTLYQIVSDLEIINNVTGALADTDQEFNYTIKFTGTATNAGTYSVQDANGDTVGQLTLDGTGVGTYTAKLTAGDKLVFKLLPGNVSYTITQDLVAGYEASSTGATVNANNIVLTGKTSEERVVTYTINNKYDVSTTLDLEALITYSEGITDGLFTLNITDGNTLDKDVANDADGKVKFDTITYDNVEGTYNYTVSQVIGTMNNVNYDTNIYTVNVIVANDGKGNLNKTVTIYNKNNEEVTSMTFANMFVRDGLTIKNNNTSAYIDEELVYNYTLEIYDSVASAGDYTVVDGADTEKGKVTVAADGTATYEFSLKSDEQITVLDLPVNTKFMVNQEVVPYYTTTINGVADTDVTDGTVDGTYTMDDASVVVLFENNYVTKGEFTPRTNIKLEGKELVADEFTFMLKEVSRTRGNGYMEYVTNNADGTVDFTTIEYNAPGTYVYEITQVAGEDKHYDYDGTVLTLTVTLEDNGDGTMDVTSSTYEFANGKDSFANTYSEVIDDEVIDSENPNTSGGLARYNILIALCVICYILVKVQKGLRRRKFGLHS